jgi:hypothetical protein
MPTWFTVDTDDFRHLPKHQGHPTRSKETYSGPSDQLSEAFRIGWGRMLEWMEAHDGAITLFVISDLLEMDVFSEMLRSALERFPERLTVGCHGHSHRSWSAWGEDKSGFEAMLDTSTALLKAHAGGAFRPYFRAPNGYIAPWMAASLAKKGYIVDSSVNPSWLVKSKTGGPSWGAVSDAMTKAGVVERPWLTRWRLPANGPALFRFPLSILAHKAWKKAPPLLQPETLSAVEERKTEVCTVYCHVLDFARKKASWVPPL